MSQVSIEFFYNCPPNWTAHHRRDVIDELTHLFGGWIKTPLAEKVLTSKNLLTPNQYQHLLSSKNPVFRLFYPPSSQHQNEMVVQITPSLPDCIAEEITQHVSGQIAKFEKSWIIRALNWLIKKTSSTPNTSLDAVNEKILNRFYSESANAWKMELLIVSFELMNLWSCKNAFGLNIKKAVTTTPSSEQTVVVFDMQ